MTILQFIVMLAGFTGAAVTVIGTIVWGIGRVKRLPSGSAPQISPEELDAIRERLAELEHREGIVAELEERMDFMERVLDRTRQARQLPDAKDGGDRGDRGD